MENSTVINGVSGSTVTNYAQSYIPSYSCSSLNSDELQEDDYIALVRLIDEDVHNMDLRFFMKRGLLTMKELTSLLKVMYEQMDTQDEELKENY